MAADRRGQGGRRGRRREGDEGGKSGAQKIIAPDQQPASGLPWDHPPAPGESDHSGHGEPIDHAGHSAQGLGAGEENTAFVKPPEWRVVKQPEAPAPAWTPLPAPEEPVWQTPVLSPPARPATAVRADKAALLSMLTTQPPLPDQRALEDVQAAPGEVPSLHSDTGLYIAWTLVAIALVAGAGIGVWAVFFRQPF